MKEIEKAIEDLIKQRKRFIIQYYDNTDKNAAETMLLFAHRTANSSHKSALISANMRYSRILKKIVVDWGLSTSKKSTNTDIENAILQEQNHFIFVADLDLADTRVVMFLSVLAEQHTIIVAYNNTYVSDRIKFFLAQWYLRSPLIWVKEGKVNMEGVEV